MKRINNSNKNLLQGLILRKEEKNFPLFYCFTRIDFVHVTCTLAFEHMSVTRFREWRFNRERKRERERFVNLVECGFVVQFVKTLIDIIARISYLFSFL